MSDLTESRLAGELRRLADDARGNTVQLPVSDVTRRGDRLRRRTVAQWSVGGLSAAGITVAVLLASGGAGVHGVAADGGATASNALTQTTSSAAGRMTVNVTYRNAGHGKITLVSVTCAGDATATVTKPVLIFSLTSSATLVSQPGSKPGHQGLPRVTADSTFVVRLRPSGLSDFTASLPASFLASVRRDGDLTAGETLTVTLGQRLVSWNSPRLWSWTPATRSGGGTSLRPAIQAGLVLTGVG
jgi:hypothetical protein